MVKKYMHTLKGSPAYFGKEQIVYAGRRHPARVYDKLSDIRRHERQTAKFRFEHGFPNNNKDYDYIRVEINDRMIS